LLIFEGSIVLFMSDENQKKFWISFCCDIYYKFVGLLLLITKMPIETFPLFPSFSLVNYLQCSALS
jgi:hypothetical protein